METPVCDSSRHLVCDPYSIEGLHRMAAALGIHPCWYEVSKLGFAHYDIPKKRIAEITAQCRVVTTRELLLLIKSNAT